MKLIADHREDNPYRDALVRGLVGFNERRGPPETWRFVGFYALDDGGRLAGGVQGAFEWDWLHIAHLWVRDPRRGLGRRLMQAAETLARDEGKRGLFLDTMEFQARPFYEKLGFSVIGRIDNAAGDNARFFMAKTLV
jgi:GNAT superfamily N-acetyltransferase